jgi:purine-binding chemotaxis protein CheW
MTRTPTSEQDLVQLAAFKVGSYECALDIMSVKEIVNPLPITPIPKAADLLEGVIELRGAIVPMVDMRRRFDLPADELSQSAKYIIVSVEGRILGLVVDEVTEVVRVARTQIHRAPPDLVDGAAQPFKGMFRHQERLIVILDLGALLTSTEKLRIAELTVPETR